MSVKYTNSKGMVYYLHRGKTKTGKERCYFSMKNEGSLCTSIPGGYEIYEHPNAQVFLRKIPKKIILDEEIAIVEDGVRKYSILKAYKIDVRKNVIQIYTPDQDVDALENILSRISPFPAITKKTINDVVNYSPDMQFVLIDKEKRIFVAQRYCYLGRIDDWINIGGPDSLDALTGQYVKHLGKESFFDIH
ncbi:hypothetical protein G3480_18725 [Thiorhodococcus mannitoliphagus]|uniref:Uncharacterized protein n=1 Tax=Thiorhodococcus mannitoliphagus TaxID=329406 RepID=A0A6P1DZ15_9GAMM|nr:hypothetical protein [Thiorhodococcus mannitoliphagus]NEX22313.1 hypothetical protein [Thiorhodococcus mannitoliphagus]